MDERTVRGELESYLKEQDMNEYFTALIESCLMSCPQNPSLHIVKHLFKTYPQQVKRDFSSMVACAHRYSGGI